MTTITRSLHGRWQLALRLAVAGAAVSLVTACAASGYDAREDRPGSEQGASAATRIAPAALAAGQVLPLTRRPLLAVEGKISSPNDGDSLQLGIDTLDQLGVLEVNVYEPWAKKRVSFQGVWLADVLEAAGADESASGVHMVALDDFTLDLTMKEIKAGGVFVATKNRDGSPIPIEEGGPTRIVFMDGVDAGNSPNQWIWSLKTIDVR